jgi:hypothetical protein
LPVEPAPGCEVEPKLAAEGTEPDEVDPPTDELPPAVEEPLDWPPLRQDEEGEEDAENEDEEEDAEKPRSGSAPAGTASESTKTSPRMCSTYCAGTPDWFTGWVNTTCNPVAVTVSAPEFDVPVSGPPIGLVVVEVVVVSDCWFGVVVVPVPV